MHFFDQYDATTFHGILRALLQGFPDVTLIRLLSKAPEGFDQKEWTMAASIASVNNILMLKKVLGPSRRSFLMVLLVLMSRQERTELVLLLKPSMKMERQPY